MNEFAATARSTQPRPTTALACFGRWPRRAAGRRCACDERTGAAGVVPQRVLAPPAGAGVAPEEDVTTADLARFGEVFAGLADGDVMDQAWR